MGGKNKCPGLVVVKANHSLYYKFSKYARQIYEYYTDRVESFGWTNAGLMSVKVHCFWRRDEDSQRDKRKNKKGAGSDGFRWRKL